MKLAVDAASSWSKSINLETMGMNGFASVLGPPNLGAKGGHLLDEDTPRQFELDGPIMPRSHFPRRRGSTSSLPRCASASLPCLKITI